LEKKYKVQILLLKRKINVDVWNTRECILGPSDLNSDEILSLLYQAFSVR